MKNTPRTASAKSWTMRRVLGTGLNIANMVYTCYTDTRCRVNAGIEIMVQIVEYHVSYTFLLPATHMHPY